jgi:ATP-dependent RNA helicase SUPV3L1/SUV3
LSAKKRANKINKNIKIIFNGLGFDQGVETLSKKHIIYLLESINIDTQDKDFKELLRDLRREWSQSGINRREIIFKALSSIDLNDNNKELSKNQKSRKIDKFSNYISEFELTDFEFKNLSEIIKCTPPNQITQKFIKRTISKIRENNYIKEYFGGFDIKTSRLNIIFYRYFEDEIFGQNIRHLIQLEFTRKELLRKIEQKNIDIESELNSYHDEFINEFYFTLDENVKSLKDEYKDYDVTLEQIESILREYILESVSKDKILQINSSIKKKLRRVLNKQILSNKQKKSKEELLARTIRDFKNLFPVARSIKRKLTLIVGETNSGKTYDAMQHLINSETGFYLAPLRLLALEGYETLLENGINASLITGEEEISCEDSFHISSTIEMLNFNIDVDTCVIDEVQMINDKDRGWAWTNAIIGVAASHVIMTGSQNSVKSIQNIAKWLDEDLEIIYKDRLSDLKVLYKPISYYNIPKNSAIICFSRKDVLNLKAKLSKQYKISVIYGNLSPEVRREEASRFRKGDTDILISTDAIAMGLNLPIQTIIFSEIYKFDGEKRRTLTSTEIQQICGRAGRYGIFDIGYITAVSRNGLNFIHDKFNEKLEDIKPPFKVMASFEHIELISKIFDSKKLHFILDFFSQNMEFDGPFVANTIDNMLEASKIVDKYDLDLKQKYYLSCAPITTKSPFIIQKYHSYIKAIERNRPIYYEYDEYLLKGKHNHKNLLLIEDVIKDITLYLWLSFKFEHFIDVNRATNIRGELNKLVKKSLKKA